MQNPFEPHPLFAGPIGQTVFGAKFPGAWPLPHRVPHRVRIDCKNSLVLFELPAQETEHPLVLLCHGMGGCSESGYMRRVAYKLWREGFGVLMMNQRGSGPGMGLCDRLWNGGSSDDLDCVVQYITQYWPGRMLLLVGFSLSGNILLKYFGEGRCIPDTVQSGFAVNPPIDLKVACQRISSGAYARMFNRYYMKLINLQARAVAECFPNGPSPMPPADLETILEFDRVYTAFAGGFSSADAYYENCSAQRFLENIRIPTTILCSRDDPFIPPSVFRTTPMSLAVHYMAPQFGGHMGYVSKNKTPLGDRRWMDYVLLDWANRLLA